MRRRDLLKGLGTALAGATLGCRGAASPPRAYGAEGRRPMPDVIVLLPGITGSVLRKDGRDVWGLSGGAIWRFLRTGGSSLRSLKLTGDSPDVDDLGDGITADRLFPDIHLVPGLWKIDGYTRVASAIQAAFRVERGRNFFEFPYDWRRDNRVAARRLARLSYGWLKAWRESSGNAQARLVLVAHSMGGLVSRYFLEQLEGWRTTRKLVTFGTPFRGSLNALNFLANGYRKAVVDLSEVLRSCTSVYQLLPIYPCYDGGDGTLARVAEAGGIPNVDRARAAQALTFHRDIEAAVTANRNEAAYRRSGYTVHPIVGTFQRTLQSARLAGPRVEMLATYRGEDQSGDGTVPRVSATPIELGGQERELYVAEVHGSLQNSGPALVQLTALLAAGATDWDQFRDLRPRVTLSVEDVYTTAEPVRVRARCEDPGLGLVAVVTDVSAAREVLRLPLRKTADDWQEAEGPSLPEGSYRVTAGRDDVASPATDAFVVVAA